MQFDKPSVNKMYQKITNYIKNTNLTNNDFLDLLDVIKNIKELDQDIHEYETLKNYFLELKNRNFNLRFLMNQLIDITNHYKNEMEILNND